MPGNRVEPQRAGMATRMREEVGKSDDQVRLMSRELRGGANGFLESSSREAISVIFVYNFCQNPPRSSGIGQPCKSCRDSTPSELETARHPAQGSPRHLDQPFAMRRSSFGAKTTACAASLAPCSSAPKEPHLIAKGCPRRRGLPWYRFRWMSGTLKEFRQRSSIPDITLIPGNLVFLQQRTELVLK